MSNERVGLLTIHDTVNYGSLLQTYSTYRALQKLDVGVKLIDYKCEAIEDREVPRPLKDCRSLREFYNFFRYYKRLRQKYDNVQKFIHENMECTCPYKRNSIINANEQFDTYLVGSDIVWGTNITGHDYSYFLDFASDEKRKLSFSSSAGTAWTEDEKKTIEPLLKRFEKINVREQLAADWVEELLFVRPDVTCDPTILWEPSYWSKMQDTSIVPKEKYVLIYAINPDRSNITDGIRYANKHAMKAYFIHFYKPVKGASSIYPYTVQQWIALFANADAVFSASYHGLLFSLYFHRNVFFYNRGEKSRMISLAEELHIQHREGNAENIKSNQPIDYDFVDKKLSEKRNYSWEVLRSFFDK